MSADDTGTKPAARRQNHVKATWLGEHRFESGRPGGPQARIDASAREGQSPVDALLSALATCTAVDVVDILAKRRTPLASLDVDVTGERSDGVPARLTRIHLTYRITGEGIEQIHADRAAELAVTKYCSVRDSLDPAMPVTWSVEILPTA
jgi:putative redox protein